MPRPNLPNETGDPTGLRMAISPNGQHMVLIAGLNSGNKGVGFYSFASGQWVQVHEAQPGEEVPANSQLSYSFTGSHFAMALRSTITSEWRVLVFETATGNAVDQLTRTSPTLHETFMTDLAYWPLVSHFGVDEGVGQAFVGLQLVNSNGQQTSFPSFRWYHNPVPALVNAPVQPAAIPFSPFAGFDVLRTSGAVAFTGFDEAGGAPANNVVGNLVGTYAAANQLPVTVVNGAGYTLNSPQWLKNGAWVGYRVQNGVQQPHFAVTGAQVDNSVPLGPNIGSIAGTPDDGFLAINAVDWQLYYATSFNNIDAFAYQFGSTVFQSGGQPFNVVYTTPEGASFTLASIPTEPGLNVQPGGDGQVQAPQANCDAAPAPRLTVGGDARVTFTNGTPLNVRTAAAGEFLMQIQEGTFVDVVAGRSSAVAASNRGTRQ